MKLDILVFAAHPDDAELSCSGIIAKEIASGKKVGIVDLTKGELGTRGSAEIRMEETKVSSQILGLSVRENLDLGDGLFEVSEKELKLVVGVIRKYQPQVILCNAPEDRHPDHGRGAALVKRATFLAGLRKFGEGEAYRAKDVFSYIQEKYLTPSVVLDITPFFDKKIESLKAFKSQFFDESSNEPSTPISSENYWFEIEARAREMGKLIGVKYGEGLIMDKPMPLKSIVF